MFDLKSPTALDFSLLPPKLPIVRIPCLIHVGNMVGYDKSHASVAGKGMPFTLSQAVSQQFNVTGNVIHELRRVDRRSGVFLDATAFTRGQASFEKLVALAKDFGLLDQNMDPTEFYHGIVSRSVDAPTPLESGLLMAMLIISEARIEVSGPFDGVWFPADNQRPAFGVVLPTRLHIWTSVIAAGFDSRTPKTASVEQPETELSKTVKYGSLIRRTQSESLLETRRRNIGRRFNAIRLKMALNDTHDPIVRELLEDALEAVVKLDQRTAINHQFTFEETGERVSVFAPNERSLEIYAAHGHIIHESIASRIEGSVKAQAAE